MNWPKKLNKFNHLIVLFLIVLIFKMFYISFRKSYYAPFRWKSIVNVTSGLHPNNTNIFLYNTETTRNNFECLTTATNPSFEVCIYSRLVDAFISRDLEDTGIWEPCITRTMQQVLELESYSILIDIGANIGYYSLLAAKSGHYVIAVEPVVNHIQRLSTALHLSGVHERVVVLKNAMANERREVTVRRSGHNQGDSQIQMASEECRGSCPPTVKSILLNDLTFITSNLSSHLSIPLSHQININNLFNILLNNNPTPNPKDDHPNIKPLTIVLKLDTQGFEHHIFTNADFFFKYNDVSHIFMEWINMKDIYNSIHKISISPKDETFNKEPPTLYDQVLIERMLSFLHGHDFVAYSTSAGTYGQALNPALWSEWPNDILWLQRSRLHEIINIFERSFMEAILTSSDCS